MDRHEFGRPDGHVYGTERHVLPLLRLLFFGHAVRRQPGTGNQKSIASRHPIETREELTPDRCPCHELALIIAIALRRRRRPHRTQYGRVD